MTTTQTTPGKAVLLERILFGLAVLGLALTPTQLTRSIKGVELTPAEVVLAIAFVVWCIRWCSIRDTRSLPPLSHWLIVGVAVLGIFSLLTSVTSLHHLGEWKHAIAQQKPTLVKIAQMVLYLLVSVTVFRAVFTSKERIRTAIIALLATTSLAVLLGVVQWGVLPRQYQPDPTKRSVIADAQANSEDEELFMSENTPDANANTPAVAAPKSGKKHKAQIGYWVQEGDRRVFHPASRWKLFLRVETPAYVSSTFGNWSKHGYHPSRNAYAGFLALVLPFALALLVIERKKVGFVIWLSLLLLGAAASVLAGYIVPAIALGLLVTGIAIGRPVGRNVFLGLVGYVVLMLIFAGITFNAHEVISDPYQLRISANDAKYYTDSDERLLKKFWGEQQAGLNVYRYHALFGVGSGRYQEAIKNGYDALGDVVRQRLEADQLNGYVFTLVTNGLLGLAALLMLLGSYLGMARSAFRQKRWDPFAAAMVGAMVAAIVMLFVTNIWVRGTSIVFAALLAMIGNYATPAPVERINQQEENFTCV